jgi:RNA polymerase sigma-70 factor (ECF subfamily)
VGAFGLELAVHIASLRRYARALVRDRGEADDLVQEALVRALGHADRFQAGTNLRAWLFTILHNVHVNQLRSRAVRPREVSVDTLPVDMGAESGMVQAAGQVARVEVNETLRLLDALPAEQRQVLLLVALEGLKYDEVASLLGVPMGTVMSRLSRAREAVRQLAAGGTGSATGHRLKGGSDQTGPKSGA